VKNPTQPEDQRRSLNQHISVDDLKKIRGGIAEGGEVGDTAMRVEKSDEDFAKPA
jgi:hypothetical protein